MRERGRVLVTAVGYQRTPTPTTAIPNTKTAMSMINLDCAQKRNIDRLLLGVLSWVFRTSPWPPVILQIGRLSLCLVLHHALPCEASLQQTSISVWP